MILVDTDHLSVLTDRRAVGHSILTARLQASGESPFATPVVSVEEQCRGWLSQINRVHDVHKQILPYERFAKLFSFLRDWQINLFNEAAADEFKRLRKERIRIGTRDLKIACTALVQNALLLSRNLRDSRRVPGLRVESWLE
jgi:tRNA(fMet)-specific endonuclease VapC